MDHMKIGDNIYHLRKEQNITQEQLADMIGITAGAVSKWENGNSMPDILLLSPLARALNTTVDTLLTFKQELSDEEIAAIKKELTDHFLHENYEAGEKHCRKYLNLYPNSVCLKLVAAGLIQMYAMLEGQEELFKDRAVYALNLLDQVLDSKEPKYVSSAYFIKANLHLMTGNYEESEKALKELINTSIDPYVLYASLYERQEKIKEAKKICKSALLQYLNGSIAMLSILARLSQAEKENEDAHLYLNGCILIEETFGVELGLSCGYYNLSRMYLKEGNKKAAAEWFGKYVDGILNAGYDFTENPYFKELKLEVNPQGQKAIRLRLFQEIYEEYGAIDLHEYEEYNQAMENLRAALTMS